MNAEQVTVTGTKTSSKLTTKVYNHHSGYPGGLKTRSFEELMAKKPEFVIESAVQGMLPKNRLGKKLIRKLKVYSGDSHPHQGQKPEPISLTEK